MWGVAIFCIAVTSCNAELYQIKTADLPKTATADHRIIGGVPTTVAKYPFVVQVLWNSRFRCGGSLLTARHVLSAAHCFVTKDGYEILPKNCLIRAGTTILNAGGSVHLVKIIKIHERYNSDDNDVAVVLMATEVDLTTSIAQPAVFAGQDAVVPVNAYVTAVGWGRTEETNSNISTVLNEVTMQKINLTTCQARYSCVPLIIGEPFLISSDMICAGILDVGGKDTCGGDSGGPLIYNGIVVGVTSKGFGCGRPEYPGVYARVASYINWIIYTVSLNDSMLENTGLPSSRGGAVMMLYPAYLPFVLFLYLILSV